MTWGAFYSAYRRGLTTQTRRAQQSLTSPAPTTTQTAKRSMATNNSSNASYVQAKQKGDLPQWLKDYEEFLYEYNV